MPVNVFYVYTVSTANSMAGIVWCVILAFNNLACFSTDMQFVRCACMLHYRFRVINNELETFASIWHFKRGALVERKTCRSFICELSYGHNICDSIEMYRYCYGQFCNMVCQLNSTYQLHLLGCISACFLKILFNLYFSMFGYVIGTNGQKEHDELIRAIFWNVFYGMRFLTIIYVANATCKQAVNAKTLITDINNRYLDTSTQEELQLFYTQISSRCIQFTACDLFTLNTRLITSAIAAGATYLVILVQFHSGKN
ncbi:gustatory receptor for sugar taste 43a-like [Aphis gossypii]|nr:gustatory receptor for sugar taste 43a-like [Aphis gossypii]